MEKNQNQAYWNGEKVTAEEYWKLRLEEVSKNPTKENLNDLLLDLDMDDSIGGRFLYQDMDEDED